MNIGINLYSGRDYKEIIEAFAENGIKRTFVNIEHPEFEEAVKALKEADIKIENFHAPYKGQNVIWEEGEAGEIMLSRFIKGVDECVKYNVPLMVAHVSNGSPMPEINEIGLERFDKLMSYAKSKGIKIAFESHRYVENVRYFLERYPEAGFCLDNGHENAFTPGVRYMPMWGERLVATHISDNEYVCNYDMHMIPFDGTIDFELAAKELAESKKDVTVMLEIKPDNHEKYKDVTVMEYYTLAAKRVRKFAEMIENYKMKG